MSQTSMLFIKKWSSDKDSSRFSHCVALKEPTVICVTPFTLRSARKAGGIPDVPLSSPASTYSSTSSSSTSPNICPLEETNFASVNDEMLREGRALEFMKQVFPTRSLNEHCQITSSSLFRTKCESGWRLWYCVNVCFEGRNMMFVSMPKGLCPQSQECRTSMMALLELGEQIFQANEVILCLKKNSISEIDMMRSIKTLLYIGFKLVSPSVYGHDSSHILLGYQTI